MWIRPYRNPYRGISTIPCSTYISLRPELTLFQPMYTLYHNVSPNYRLHDTLCIARPTFGASGSPCTQFLPLSSPPCTTPFTSKAKGERARRGKPRIPRLRYLLMPLWLKKKAWNFLVTSGRERGRGRGSCDVATPEDFLIKNGRERLRKHSTSTAIVSDDLSARRAKRKGGGGKRGSRRRKNGGTKIQVENTGDVVFFGHHQPRPRGEITRQNRKNGDGTTEISLRQPTLSCICGREGREWEREGGRHSYYNACAWSPFVSLFPFFFFLFFLSFFFIQLPWTLARPCISYFSSGRKMNGVNLLC